MKAGIYIITNKKNNRFYIGSSKNIEKRVKKHFYMLKTGKHKNPFWQNDFKKYTINDYSWKIHEIIENEEQRLLRENILLKQFHDNQKQCYNINKNAFSYGKYKTKEGLETIKENCRKMAAKVWADPEFRKKHKAICSSKEHKDKIKIASRECNSKFISISLYDPDNNLITLNGNHNEIAKQMGVSKSNFSGLILGRYKIIGGWSKHKKQKWIVSNGVEFYDVYEYKILTFCKKYNISSGSHFKEMLMGKRKKYGCWVLKDDLLFL